MGQALVLLPVGVVVGLVGSLIGVGGGFFIVPFLLLFFGEFVPETATAASLGIIFLGSISSTVANTRRRRIDWRTGLILAAGTLPGAWYGRVVIGRISDRTFAWAFAALLFSIALYLILVRLKPGKGLMKGAPREVTDSEGQRYAFQVNAPVGFLASLGVGLISSLFGVGGGLILVPFLVVMFGVPTLVATATLQFTFIFTTAAGLAVAAAHGQLTAPGLQVIGLMGTGVIVGAQLGVACAKRVREKLIRWMIAAVTLAVAVVMFLKH